MSLIRLFRYPLSTVEVMWSQTIHFKMTVNHDSGRIPKEASILIL